MPDKTSEKKRQPVFKIIAVSIPFILLMVMELTLRLFHYGNDPSLFLEDIKKPGYVYNNTHISNRFFVNEQDAPTSYSQVFKKNKPSNTYRIFVLGGSSALGFPYNHRGSFPRMLEYWLSRTFPDKKFEMINLSITAVNSYTLLSFSDEIVEMKPDAILIYAGHNEYYGAMGVGSNHRIGLNRNIIKMIIYLKKYRVSQLVMNFSSEVRKLFSKKEQDNKPGLMRKMAGEQEIALDSKLYRKGLQQFEDNMDELLQIYNKRHIPVYFSDIVSNLKGQKPFISMLDIKTDTVNFMKEFHSGMVAYKDGNYETALDKFQTANKIDSSYAMNNFSLGEIFYRKGDYDRARQFYTSAKELDVLRFRAPEAINSIIRELSLKYNNIHFVPTEDKFVNYSPNHILDNSLFTDHLHPNLDGYFLISQAFYDKMKETKLFGSWNKSISPDSIKRELPVTAVDSVYGSLIIMFMKEEWPFYEPASYNKDKNKSYPEQLGIKMFLKQINWETAMDSLYQYYLTTGNYPEAIKVAKSVDLEHPYESRLAEEIAKLYMNTGNYEESLNYYKKAFEIEPKVDIARKIVLNLLQLDKLEESIKFLEYLSREEPRDNMSIKLLEKVAEVLKLKNQVVSEPGNTDALNKLAGYYLYVGNLSEAKIYIDKNLAINPDNKISRNLLSEFEKLRDQKKSTK